MEGGGVGEGDGAGDSSLHQQRPFWVLGGAAGTASWKPKPLKPHLNCIPSSPADVLAGLLSPWEQGFIFKIA